MEVYVVTSGIYSDYMIHAVFLDREKAESYVNRQGGKYLYEDFKIEIFEADEPEKETERSIYTFYYSGDYKLQRFFREDASSYVPAIKEYDAHKWIDNFTETTYKEIRFEVLADSKEKAKKIAQDRIAEYKYRKEIEEKI